MDTDCRHSIWELELADKSAILASHLIELMGAGDDDIAQVSLKRCIAKGDVDGRAYVRCSECGCPLVYVAKNAVQPAYFRHQVSRTDNLDRVKKCSFYTKSHQFFGSASIYHGEGKWHMEHKYWLASLLRASPQIADNSVLVEKYLFDKDPDKNTRRRPDIYFETVYGDCFAIELTRWWMDPRIVVERERFFRRQGINLLWLFSPTCAEHNEATYNLVLYSGERKPSTKPEFTDVDIGGHFNVFVLTDDAKHRSNKEKKLWFDVQYPVFSSLPDIQYLSKSIQSKTISLSELNLDPEHRLPFAVPTSDNYRDALEEYRRKVEKDTQDERNLLAKKIRSARTFHCQLKQDIGGLLYHDVQQNIMKLQKLMRSVSSCTFSRYLQKRTNCLIDELHAHKRKLDEEAQKKRVQLQLKQIEARLIESQRRVHGIYRVDPAKELRELEKIQVELLQIQSTTSDDKTEQLLTALNTYIQNFSSIPNEPVSLDLPGTKEKLAECYEFLNELNGIGVTELPTGHNDIKLTRLQRKCEELGRYDLSLQLSKALSNAERQFKIRYTEENFPALSKGWEPCGHYRHELHKAKLIINTEYRRGHKNFAKHEALRRLMYQILWDFRESIQKIIEQQHGLILKHFSGSIDKAELKKLINCAGYIEKYLNIPLDDEHKRLVNETFTIEPY
ncbi:hypothetical protein VIBNISOn1_1890026 [Vibrio nigripulchritudo SOn1]|uniref:Uncharacterized protein n=1 Tax=Vibrio nigripulchritudo SOn1 TaxID=1238450 RepID=A0AAV2VQR9_9VIBR|nr:hypothetical protein [Vibrio nigripulchritudo]CCO46778.1 hypothetical protein VIBNISOn1_1890026 [Vibrio nigripulchritudo SOn1]